MWKDWQELGLVIILGMLLAGLFQQINLTGEGSMFAGLKQPVAGAVAQKAPVAGAVAQKAPVAAQSTKATTQAPAPLRYTASGGSERVVTFVYGPAHAARIVCKDKLTVLRWSKPQHSVRLPESCYLAPDQTGVYTSSSAA